MSAHLFDPDIAFDITFSHFGGRWKPSEEDEGFHIRLLRYVESIPAVLTNVARERYPGSRDASHLIVPEVHFGLLNTQTLNCFASVGSDRYFVGMSAMMPVALLEISAHFFANTDFFPDIGDIENGPVIILDGLEETPLFQISENRFFPKINDKISKREAHNLIRSIATTRGAARRYDSRMGERLSARDYLVQFNTIIELILPRCKIRKFYANHGASLISYFFWLHEISHVTQGHLRTLQLHHRAERVQLFELPDPVYANRKLDMATPDGPSVLAMELDADCEAAMLTLALILNDLDIEDGDPEDMDRYERAKLFTFMLLAVFGAMSRRSERAATSNSSSSHPPIRMRLINLFSYLNGMSSHDAKLNEAVSVGATMAAGYGRYEADSYLRVVRSIDQAEMEELFRLDQMRKVITNSAQNYNYGNLRVLGLPHIVDFIDNFRSRT